MIVNVQSGEITVIERDYTADEISEVEVMKKQLEQNLSEPTVEDRLSAVEAALLEMITGGESGG